MGCVVIASSWAFAEDDTDSPLPLAVGNRWILGGSPLVEVTGIVTIRDISADTVYSSFDAAVGLPGTEYFVLRIEKHTKMFPVDPDTAVVRTDSAGNVWCRAVVHEGLTKVAAVDQPWLMVDGPEMRHLQFDKYEFSVAFERCGGSLSYMDHARRYASSVTTDLMHGSDHRLMRICGTLDGNLMISEGGGLNILVLLTGVGPIWIPLFTTETELQGIHYELQEARIDGREIRPTSTLVKGTTWSEMKMKRGQD